MKQDPRVQKLAIKLADLDLAEKLVKAGLDSPKKIRRASDAEIEKALGKPGKSKVRDKMPKVKA